jgi:hypothetical protein
MNKKQILASLNKISNELDNSRLYKEATSVTSVMKRIASNPDYKVNDEMFDDMETIFNPFPQVREPGYNIQEGTPEYGKALFMEEIKSIIGDYTPDQQQIIATHVSHLIELDERRRQVAIQNLYDEIKNNGEFHIIYGGIIDLIQFTEDFAEESQIPLEELGSKLEDFQGFYPDSRVKLSNKKDKQMNKRQILASLSKIANELDNMGLTNEADKVTDVMNNISDKNVEDTRPGYEKMASKRISQLQDKLTQYISEGYKRSDRGIETSADDLQATVMMLVNSDDPAKMLMTQAYKTGAKFRDGIILTIIDVINKLKSDPQRYGMDTDVDRFINNLS